MANCNYQVHIFLYVGLVNIIQGTHETGARQSRYMLDVLQDNRSETPFIMMKITNLKKRTVIQNCPLILLASCISFCMIVTLFACMAQRLVSSSKWTKKASHASCRANTALDCHLIP